MISQEELFSVCNPDPWRKAILNEDDDKIRAGLKGVFIACEMYTNDVRYYIGNGNIEGLKHSLMTKDIEMDTLFQELIVTKNPLDEQRLRTQINHGIFIREKLLSML